MINRQMAVLTVLAGVSLAGHQVLAQSSHLALEEIVVTAQKRAQSVRDIGIAVAAFDNDDLQELNTDFAVNVANYTTNVQVQTGFNQPYFNIRGLGINEFSGNTDSPVAIHVDDVFLSKATQASIAMFDVERVELLKEPQGTLFGRNTTGGSVNIITRKPNDEFEAGVDISYGNYERLDTEGYISGPLSDQVSARLSWATKNSSKGVTFNQFDNSRTGDYGTWSTSMGARRR